MTKREIIRQFWRTHPKLSRKLIRDYRGDGWMFETDTRVAFADYIDALHRGGLISDRMADSITLIN